MFSTRVFIALCILLSSLPLPGKLGSLISMESNSRLQRSEVIIVFAGGGGERIKHAAKLAESGLGKRILILGTEAEKNCALSILKPWFPEEKVSLIIPKRSVKDTHASALQACRFLLQSKWSKGIVVSDSWHLRRIKLLMEHYYTGAKKSLSYSGVSHRSKDWKKSKKRRALMSSECAKLAACAIMTFV